MRIFTLWCEANEWVIGSAVQWSNANAFDWFSFDSGLADFEWCMCIMNRV